ncbi:MAG: LeuD/DmdB family oxidoreductase small subunit [Promethearchaeota archaeon]
MTSKKKEKSNKLEKVEKVEHLSSLPSIKGRIWVLGDAIDTDLIVPSRVLTEQDPTKLIAATLENVIPSFADKVQPGDIIIAGTNFGCGSSREEAVFVLKELGVQAIIASSFARIFFRNAINLGLPPIKVADAPSLGIQGDVLEILWQEGIIHNHTQNIQRNFPPFPPFLQNYVISGGALNLLRQNLEL